MNNSKRSGGSGFYRVLTIVFIVLKLTDVINWSWLWVLSPLWIEFIMILILVVIIELFQNNNRSKRNRSDKLKW